MIKSLSHLATTTKKILECDNQEKHTAYIFNDKIMNTFALNPK